MSVIPYSYRCWNIDEPSTKIQNGTKLDLFCKEPRTLVKAKNITRSKQMKYDDLPLPFDVVRSAII